MSRAPGNLQRLAATVTLHDAGDLDCGVALILQATQTQAVLQAERDVGEHVGEFLLHQLIRSDGLAELLAVEHVLARAPVAIFRSTESAPCDTVTRAVLRQVKGPFNPRTSGKAFSSGQNTSSRTISPVMEAFRPTLPCTAGAERPLAPLSSTNPRIEPSSPLAQTTKTYAIGLFVIP
jgi:hypothetical protein